MDGKVENNQTVSNLKGKVIQVPLVDETLSKAGYAADAKVVGEALSGMATTVANLDPHGASKVVYDNAESGLESGNIQDAVDEIAAKYIPSATKPTGSYVGDGKTTERTVQIGGNGSILSIVGNTYTSLVSVHGSITIKSNAEGVTHLLNSQIQFYNGILTIKSDHIGINASNITYTYRLL